MSDISKINIENKEYKLKDAEGRARAEEAATEAVKTAKNYTNAQLNALKGAVSADFNTLEKIEDKIEELDSSVDERFSNLNESLDTSFDGIDEQIGSTNAKVSQVETTANNALALAQNKNLNKVFETTSAMYTWLANAANKGQLQVGSALYIKEADVPDWWITEVLNAPNANGRYYNIAPLEAEGAGGAAGSTVSVQQTLTSGTKIGSITIDGSPTDLYAPTDTKYTLDNITGTLAVGKGGTGATDAATARTNIGLGNVNNTADIDKPISKATQTALDAKANKVDLNGLVTVDTYTGHAMNRNNPHFVTKEQVGLGNVDDTSDANKPISTATQTALDEIKDNLNRRSFILIGDSFGGGVINATTNGDGWINHFKEYTRNKYTVYNNQTPLGGVYGFASSRPFLDVLKDCELQVEDKSTITDIVVLGGTNDLGVSRTLIEPAIRAFAEYCHANFPNALVKIGLVGTAISSLYELVPHYRSCNKYGCVFVQDTLCLMNDTSLISDGTHLTQEGYDLYDPYICNAILSGSCHYKFIYALPITSDVMNTGRMYIQVTEKGYSIELNSGVGGDYLQGCIFEVTPPHNDKFTQIIGTVNIPNLFVYYIRLQNGKTSHVVRIGDQYVVSSCRQFSVWLSPSGELYCEIGVPAYPDAGSVQSVIIGNEPYTYLV